MLAAGDPQYGLWFGLADSYAAEVCSGAGADWVLIDAANPSNNVQNILAQLQAVQATSEVMVRTADNSPQLLGQLLDLGVNNFVIPGVTTVEMATQVVAATRYPPSGTRAVANVLNRAAGFGQQTNYLRTAHESICIFIQIDSANVLNSMDSIGTVPGVDGVFISPGDLAASLGHLGNRRHPQVIEAMEYVLEWAQDRGVNAGFAASSAADGIDWSRKGASLITLGSDVGILKRGAQGLFAEVRGRTPSFY